jgi:hypothetical protein
MQSKFTIHMTTRRAFGTLAAASNGFAAALLHATDGAARALLVEQTTFPVYSFVPLEDGVLTTCKSCLSHAKNKRFASLDAAEGNRAHLGCKCTIAATASTEGEFVKMFGGIGDAIDRFVYDLRWPNQPGQASQATVGGLEMPVARER